MEGPGHRDPAYRETAFLKPRMETGRRNPARIRQRGRRRPLGPFGRMVPGRGPGTFRPVLGGIRLDLRESEVGESLGGPWPGGRDSFESEGLLLARYQR